jgi:hypothetical protein
MKSTLHALAPSKRPETELLVLVVEGNRSPPAPQFLSPEPWGWARILQKPPRSAMGQTESSQIYKLNLDIAQSMAVFRDRIYRSNEFK